MTTHDMQPETADQTVRTDRPAEPQPMEPPVESADTTGGFANPTETGHAPDNPSHAPTDTADLSDAMLFADSELTDMRSRWVEVQSAFVDDPRDCVQKADGLVADVVDKLTTSFSGARAHLEEQWSRGEEVSTEDLRIALKRYREFFERLLAV
ncbi:MAG: hypothetical protein QOJ24_2091 [Mycobacterium sp.]|jgi:hypothetical protein|nr:hypothetical protein [Mycobacterium sp.]